MYNYEEQYRKPVSIIVTSISWWLETVWNTFKICIRSRPHPPTSLAELKVACQEAWESIVADEVNHHVWSMPDRVAAVMAAQGGPTWY